MTYPEQPSTFEDIKRIAQGVLDRTSKNMVGDAIVLARWILMQPATKDSPDERRGA